MQTHLDLRDDIVTIWFRQHRVLRDETIETHRKVVQAISRHNSKAAKKAMEEHIIYNRDNFRALPEKKAMT